MKSFATLIALILFALHATAPMSQASDEAETPAETAAPAEERTEAAPLTQAERLRHHAELRLRISELNQRRDRMLIEIQAVEREIAALNEQANALDPNRPAEVATDDEKKETDTARPERPTHRSMMSIMNGLPRDARPSARDGWNMFNVEVAKKWLNDERKGDRVNFRTTIGSIQVTRNESQIDAALARADWIVTLSVRPLPATFAFVTTQNGVTLANAEADGRDQFVFKVDENFARRASQLKSGDTINIEGDIYSVDMTGSGQRGNFKLTLRNANIVGYGE